MNLLGKALVFAFIGLATCTPFNNNLNFGNIGPPPDAQAKQDAELEQVLSQASSLIESVQAKCKAAGKESIGESLDNTLKEAFGCIQRKINPNELKEQFEAAGRTGNIDEVFNKLCSLWPQAHTCLDKLIKDSRQCLDKESQHALDQTIGLFDDSNNFFCENNHKRLLEFFQEGGPQCLQAVASDIGTCAQPVLEKRAGKPKDDKLTYDDEDCSDFKELRACVYSQTTRCKSQVPAKITDDYLAIIQKVGCNSASSLTWFSTFNLILVLCTYLYSKMF